MIKNILLITTFVWLVYGCGSSSSLPENRLFEVMEPKSCLQKDRNQFIYDVLKDSYLWSDKVGDINISLEVDDATFLDNFLYKERDKFSFIISRTLFEEQFNSGIAEDLGFLSTQKENDNGTIETIVAFVYPESPADKAGLKRSDIILSADENNFLIRTQEGIERTIMIESTAYDVRNVLYPTIFTKNGKKIGYFLFKSFIGPNLVTNLDQAFTSFKEEGISELIVDLRYNGGGLLDVAAHLGALIAGSRVEGHVLQYNRYNRKYAHYNRSTFFDSTSSASLDLNRVIFLTTSNSASASESLINGLRASKNGIEVVTIGTATYGKPYGMHTMAYCDKVLVPIHFADENSDGVGGFIDGLTPTCREEERFIHDFADENESLLASALYYIENGACQP